MALTTIWALTSQTANITSDWHEVSFNRDGIKPFAIELFWENGAGTFDGTITLIQSLDETSGWDGVTVDTLNITAATGSHIWDVATPQITKFKLKYTENNMTSIDISARFRYEGT